MASHQNLDLHAIWRKKLAEYAAEPPQLPPLLTGNDLIAFGLRPGPAFKGFLDAAMDEQLEGKIRTKEEAVEWAKKHLHPS